MSYGEPKKVESLRYFIHLTVTLRTYVDGLSTGEHETASVVVSEPLQASALDAMAEHLDVLRGSNLVTSTDPV